MSDKHQIRIDVRVFVKFVLYIFYENLVQRAPVFFPYAHAAVPVVYLDTGLQLQDIRAKRGHGGTAASRMHEGQGIKDEAGVALCGPFAQSLCDGRRVHALFDHLAGGYDKEPGSGRKIAAVYHMDMPQLFCCKTAVLIHAGEGVPQVDMDDFVSVLHPRTEVVNIFLYVYSRGFWQDLWS